MQQGRAVRVRASAQGRRPRAPSPLNGNKKAGLVGPAPSCRAVLQHELVVHWRVVLLEAVGPVAMAGGEDLRAEEQNGQSSGDHLKHLHGKPPACLLKDVLVYHGVFGALPVRKPVVAGGERRTGQKKDSQACRSTRISFIGRLPEFPRSRGRTPPPEGTCWDATGGLGRSQLGRASFAHSYTRAVAYCRTSTVMLAHSLSQSAPWVRERRSSVARTSQRPLLARGQLAIPALSVISRQCTLPVPATQDT